MQICPPSVNVNCNTSNLVGVTHSVSLSPDGKGVAKTSGKYRRDPGRVCHYDNGVNGTCIPKHGCHKGQKDLILGDYNDTWKCPEHVDEDRQDRICCPFPGEENMLPGRENALRNSKKLC